MKIGVPSQSEQESLALGPRRTWIPFDFQHFLGRPARERKAHDAACFGSRLALRFAPGEVKDPGPIGTHLGHSLVVGSGNNPLGVLIPSTLLKYVQVSGTVGKEQHRLAVERPSAGPVDAIILSEPPRLLQLRRIPLQFSDVYVALIAALEKRQALSIRGDLEVTDSESRERSNAPWISRDAPCACVDVELPKTRVWCIGGLHQLVKHLVAQGPRKIPQPGVRHNNGWGPPVQSNAL